MKVIKQTALEKKVREWNTKKRNSHYEIRYEDNEVKLVHMVGPFHQDRIDIITANSDDQLVEQMTYWDKTYN